MSVDPDELYLGPTTAEIHSMLGRQVRVRLDSAPCVVAEGQLLGFGDGGDVELLGSDGLVYHCWPRLRIELAE